MNARILLKSGKEIISANINHPTLLADFNHWVRLDRQPWFVKLLRKSDPTVSISGSPAVQVKLSEIEAILLDTEQTEEVDADE